MYDLSIDKPVQLLALLKTLKQAYAVLQPPDEHIDQLEDEIYNLTFVLTVHFSGTIKNRELWCCCQEINATISRSISSSSVL